MWNFNEIFEAIKCTLLLVALRVCCNLSLGKCLATREGPGSGIKFSVEEGGGFQFVSVCLKLAS